MHNWLNAVWADDGSEGTGSCRWHEECYGDEQMKLCMNAFMHAWT